MKVIVFGCGFLTSHLLPQIAPFVEQYILIDREKVEQVNYENYLLPRDHIGKRKVTAFMSLLQALTPASVSPVHMDIKSVAHIEEVCNQFEPDIGILGFDNIPARVLVRDYSKKSGLPVLSLAVSEDFIHVDWVECIPYPPEGPEMDRAVLAMKKIRDVCTRIEFRGLGTLAASLGYQAFVEWKDHKKKLAYMGSTKQGPKIAVLEREP